MPDRPTERARCRRAGRQGGRKRSDDVRAACVRPPASQPTSVGRAGASKRRQGGLTDPAFERGLRSLALHARERTKGRQAGWLAGKKRRRVGRVKRKLCETGKRTDDNRRGLLVGLVGVVGGRHRWKEGEREREKVDVEWTRWPSM